MDISDFDFESLRDMDPQEINEFIFKIADDLKVTEEVIDIITDMDFLDQTQRTHVLLGIMNKLHDHLGTEDQGIDTYTNTTNTSYDD